MTRDLAIKVIKRMIKTGIAYDDGYAYEPLTNDEKEALDMAIKSLKQKTEWIPASKELPKEGEEVLVWYEYFRYGDYNCMWQTYGIGWQYDGHFDVDNGGVKQRVIAWMPLPEPYKVESEGE